eukprot:13707501-Alexandrium_andersonii.AAC.1
MASGRAQMRPRQTSLQGAAQATSAPLGRHAGPNPARGPPSHQAPRSRQCKRCAKSNAPCSRTRRAAR